MQRNRPPGRGRREGMESPPGGIFTIHQLQPACDLAGAVFNRRYEIISSLGKGGMARVYLAHDRETGGNVALKLLSGEPERYEELSKRLLTEASAIAKIGHENVIAVLDVGIHKGQLYCVMEHVQGRALSELISDRKAMDWERALRIIVQICDALDAAHEQGVLHRDIKPENIMIVTDGQGELVKVLDFGLAKLADDSQNLTSENLVLGTPTYLAPEQVWNRGVYDHRVDIYALGILAYELACGSTPFASDDPDNAMKTLQILTAHRDEVPQKPSARSPSISIPPHAEDAIMRAIAKKPDDRFQSAGEFADALLGVVPGNGMDDDAPEITILGKGSMSTMPPSGPASMAPGSMFPASIAPGPPSVAPISLAPPKVPSIAPPSRSPSSLAAPPPAAPPSLFPEGGELVMRESWGSRAARTLRKAAVAATLVAAVGFAVHQYWDRITQAAGTARKTMDEAVRVEGIYPEQKDNAAAPPAQPAHHGYVASIESHPEGATIFEVPGQGKKMKKLGITPAEIHFDNWENQILVAKSGYGAVRVNVTGSSPKVNVRLARADKAAPVEGTGGPPPAENATEEGDVDSPGGAEGETEDLNGKGAGF